MARPGRRACAASMPAIPSPTGSATSPSGSRRSGSGGAGFGPRWRSAAIMCCPTRRRCRWPRGLLAAEMGMNLQMALGQKRFLLLHAASVEKDGRALSDDRPFGRRQIDPGRAARRARLALHGRRIRPARPRRRPAPPLPARGQPQERVASACSTEVEPDRLRTGADRHAQGHDPPPAPRMPRRSRGWASRRGRC